MSAGEQLGSPTPVIQVIAEWRNTARIYADPELLKILRSQTIEDGGEISAPTTAS
jgi:hypothetical protein